MSRDTNRKTLLEGFGEATEQVVALRKENERLRATIEQVLGVLEAYPYPLYDVQGYQVHKGLREDIKTLLGKS